MFTCASGSWDLFVGGGNARVEGVEVARPSEKVSVVNLSPFCAQIAFYCSEFKT